MPFPKLQKVNAEFMGKDEMQQLEKYIEDHVKYIYDLNRGIRTELIPKWLRTYRGTPAEEERTFPWPGASNLIIQVAATHADELLSRIMSIYTQESLFTSKLLSTDMDGKLEDERQMIEEYLNTAALEPDDLDLYRVEETWFGSTIRYGTGIVMFPWETITEKQYVWIAGGSEETGKQTYKLDDITKRDGPHPENVPLNLFGINTKDANLATSKFFYRVRQLNRTQLEEMLENTDVYDQEKIERLLSHPTRNAPDEAQLAKDEGKKVETSGSVCADQWDIYECWFKYRKPGNSFSFSLIANYSLEQELHLGCIFNGYPENINPFEDAKLAYDDESFHGYGFMEMLDAYQREVSATHNWRTDNRQFATTGIGRVNKTSKLASILQIYPGILIPADKDEVEWFQQNSNAMAMGTEDEQLTLSLAKERSGVDPAMGGSGGGIVNAKRGIYSAQGTAAVMQVQNNRNNLRLSDMRSAHVRLGRKILTLRAAFGLGTDIRKWGDRALTLKDALEHYKDKKLGLIIKPATASSNKELEKQNDILMGQNLTKVYGEVAQMMQAMAQTQDPNLKGYFADVIKSIIAFNTHVLRNFNYDDVGRLLPVPEFLKPQNRGNNGQQQLSAGVSQGQATRVNPQNAPGPQSVPGNVPISGREDVGSVPS